MSAALVATLTNSGPHPLGDTEKAPSLSSNSAEGKDRTPPLSKETITIKTTSIVPETGTSRPEASLGTATLERLADRFATVPHTAEHYTDDDLGVEHTVINLVSERSLQVAIERDPTTGLWQATLDARALELTTVQGVRIRTVINDAISIAAWLNAGNE